MIMIPVRTIKSPNDEKYNTEKKTHFIWSRFNLIVSFCGLPSVYQKILYKMSSKGIILSGCDICVPQQ